MGHLQWWNAWGQSHTSWIFRLIAKSILYFIFRFSNHLATPVSSTSCLCAVRASTIDPFHTLQLYVPHGSLTSWEKSSTGSCTVVRYSASENAIWEYFFEFSRLYPDFHLEDGDFLRPEEWYNNANFFGVAQSISCGTYWRTSYITSGGRYN